MLEIYDAPLYILELSLCSRNSDPSLTLRSRGPFGNISAGDILQTRHLAEGWGGDRDDEYIVKEVAHTLALNDPAFYHLTRVVLGRLPQSSPPTLDS